MGSGGRSVLVCLCAMHVMISRLSLAFTHILVCWHIPYMVLAPCHPYPASICVFVRLHQRAIRAIPFIPASCHP